MSMVDVSVPMPGPSSRAHFCRLGGPPALAVLAAAVCLASEPGLDVRRTPAAQVVPEQTASSGETLLARVRENLRRERELLLEHVYREKRHPLKVSPFGKVSVGDEQTFEMRPSADPDRPYRVLVAVNARAPTADEREQHERREAERRERGAQRRAEERRNAQARFDDAFRVFTFALGDSTTLDGTSSRVVVVMPRPEAETQSDLGKWMKKFRGHAWVSERDAQLIRLELTATDSISLGWGIIGRIAEGTKVTYVRRPVEGGLWFPASARFEARGRTLLFRSFAVDSTTEWFDYHPIDGAAATPVTSR